jgi:hypothetical protein
MNRGRFFSSCRLIAQTRPRFHGCGTKCRFLKEVGLCHQCLMDKPFVAMPQSFRLAPVTVIPLMERDDQISSAHRVFSNRRRGGLPSPMGSAVWKRYMWEFPRHGSGVWTQLGLSSSD